MPEKSSRQIQFVQSRSKAVSIPAKVSTSSSTPAVSPDVAELKDMAKSAVLRNTQNQGQTLQNPKWPFNLTNMLFQVPSTFYNPPLLQVRDSSPGNTVTTRGGRFERYHTRVVVAYQGPTIPSTSSSSPKVMNRDTEVTKDTMLPTNNGSTEDVQPSVVQVQSRNPIFEPVVAPVSALMPNQRTLIPFPSRRNDERRREKS
ncbi:hypothetical protein Tco_0080129 [Tanacetum coccineum]